MIEINLLPQKYRKKARKRIDINLPLVLGALLLIFFLIFVIIEAQAKLKKAEVEHLSAMLEDLGGRFNEAKVALGEIRPLNQRLKKLREMGENRILLARLLNDLSDVFPGGLQLTLMQDEGDVLILKGIVPPGKGDESVTYLIRSLKEEGKTCFPDYFSKIALESIKKQKKGEGKEFRIKCRFSKEFSGGS